ncbi:MAG: AMP-binding protein [Desulfobacterales bacterium]|nr:AMP-binding protein [Desulfobacterales bacterium]
MVRDHIRKRVIHKVLDQQVKKYGNRTFMYFKDSEFGYEDLNQRANRIACGLQRLGIEKGDKVAIMLPNCPEFVFLMVGLSKLGAVEVPINTAHKGDLLTYMLDNPDARVLIAANQFMDRLKPILPDARKIERVIVVDFEGEGMPELDKPLEDWADVINNDGSYEPVDVLWSDPYGIMYTSGTTGPSKGVLLPQNYALYMGEIIIEAAEYSESDCLYNALPFFHGNAQVLSFMPALMSDARMVLAERFSASRFWGDVKHYGCTEFNYLGGIIPILSKADPKPDDADNPIRVMLGAAAPKDIFEAFEKRFGVKLVEVYGMNEIGLPLMANLNDRRPGSCGKVRPDYIVKVVDDDGLEVGPNTPGEMLVRPLKPYSMLLEYYRMPGKTIESWQDLWFHTGDFAEYDDKGYFYFVDRKKDALRRRGENISSYEVEKVINLHPSVLESAAIAVKSELGEDEVMICLTLKEGQSLTPQELMAHCEERMAYFMVPRYVRIMDKLPKTPTERIQKVKLREEGITKDTWDREAAGYKIKR